MTYHRGVIASVQACLSGQVSLAFWRTKVRNLITRASARVGTNPDLFLVAMTGRVDGGPRPCCTIVVFVRVRSTCQTLTETVHVSVETSTVIYVSVETKPISI